MGHRQQMSYNSVWNTEPKKDERTGNNKDAKKFCQNSKPPCKYKHGGEGAD